MNKIKIVKIKLRGSVFDVVIDPTGNGNDMEYEIHTFGPKNKDNWKEIIKQRYKKQRQNLKQKEINNLKKEEGSEISLD